MKITRSPWFTGRLCHVRRAALGILAIAAILTSGSVTAAPTYSLEAGDHIEIRVFGQPDLTVAFKVPPHGRVSYPLLGTITLVGRAPEQVEQEIRNRLKQEGILKAPTVSVLVQEFASRAVYVMGSVETPGQYEMPLARPLLLSNAISEAGGFKEDADRRHVRIYRVQNGAKRTFEVDFRQVEDARNPEANVALQPGDQVIVPQLKAAYVVGEVLKPGEIRIPSDGLLTISQALSLAGGFNERTADLSEVVITRQVSGTVRRITVNVRNFLEDDPGAKMEPTVEPGDLIYVPRRGPF